MTTQSPIQQSDKLQIKERIAMLELIKPLTDYLREITSNHDVNGLNSKIISALLPCMGLTNDQIKGVLKLIDDEIERNSINGDDAYNPYWDNIKGRLSL